jgi:hypothetical protein
VLLVTVTRILSLIFRARRLERGRQNSLLATGERSCLRIRR